MEGPSSFPFVFRFSFVTIELFCEFVYKLFNKTFVVDDDFHRDKLELSYPGNFTQEIKDARYGVGEGSFRCGLTLC